MRVFRFTRLLLAVYLGARVLHPQLAAAHDESPKARLSSVRGSLENVRYEPVRLSGGSELMFISPTQWAPLATSLLENLKTTHTDFSILFGNIPQISTSIRLMDEDTFFLSTKAPRWTNAMFLKGQIVIPMPRDEHLDMENLRRSVKHEYTHAVIHSLSGGVAPGWLDEGMAQWAEGTPPPALYQALNNWLERNPPVPLSRLQGGFTRLDTQMVPAAYAQSLVATRYMLSAFGFLKIRRYFDELRAGTTKSDAFLQAFGIRDVDFEKRLGCVLGRPHCIINPRGNSCSSCADLVA